MAGTHLLTPLAARHQDGQPALRPRAAPGPAPQPDLRVSLSAHQRMRRWSRHARLPRSSTAYLAYPWTCSSERPGSAGCSELLLSRGLTQCAASQLGYRVGRQLRHGRRLRLWRGQQHAGRGTLPVQRRAPPPDRPPLHLSGSLYLPNSVAAAAAASEPGHALPALG
jgi:hypothetical protein